MNSCDVSASDPKWAATKLGVCAFNSQLSVSLLNYWVRHFFICFWSPSSSSGRGRAHSLVPIFSVFFIVELLLIRTLIPYKYRLLLNLWETYRGSIFHEVLDVLLRLLAIFIVAVILVIAIWNRDKIVLTSALHLDTFGHLFVVAACRKTVLGWGDRFAQMAILKFNSL